MSSTPGGPTHEELRQRYDQFFCGMVPHNRALGLRLREFGDGMALCAIAWHERLVGDPERGVLHGGAITSLMDATCGASVFFKMKAPVPIATLDLRIDYLRPAEPGR